jgi:hypothetical protein
MSNLKVAKELTVKELKAAYTKEDIKNIFEDKGMYINTINEKGDSHNGMTIAFNKEDSLFYFSSYVLAFHYFLEMNWI